MSYIGIGTTDPNHPLEVAGQVYVEALEDGSSSHKVPFEVYSNYNGFPQLQNSRQLRLRVRPSNLDSNVNMDMGLENMSGSYFFMSQPVINQTNGDRGTFVITQNKQVGMGTTNPQDLLHLNSDSDTFVRINTQETSEAGVSILKDGNVKWKEYVKGSDSTLYFNNGTDDVFKVGSGGSLSSSGPLTTQGGYLNATGTLSIAGSIQGSGSIDMGSQFSVNASGSLTCGDSATIEGSLNVKQYIETGVLYATSAVIDNFAIPTSNLVLGDWLPNASDTTTRFGFPTGTSNQFAVEIAGTEKFRVHSNGNVGISSASPAKALDVSGDVRSSFNMYTTNLYLGAEENRGLTTPDTGKGGNVVTVGTGNNGQNGYSIDNEVGLLYSSGTSQYGLYNQTGGYWDVHADTGTGVVNLNYLGNTKLTTGNTGIAVTGTISTTSDIISGGNVGIGSTQPAYSLDVSGSINYTTQVKENGTNVINNYKFVGSGGVNTTGDIVTTGTYKQNGNNVINSSSAFVGSGGVSTAGTVEGGSVTSTAGITAAGTIQGNGINSTGNFQIGGSAVINGSSRFVGSGGINTSGDIVTSGTMQAGGASTTGVGLAVKGTSNTCLIIERTGNGNATIGKTSTGHLDVINDGTGGVRLTAGGTSWAAISDERLKKNITVLDNNLEKISNIRPVSYHLKLDADSREKRIGFIAQDWLSVQPEVVSAEEPDNYSLKYTETIPILCGAIQELLAQVNELKERVNTLQ